MAQVDAAVFGALGLRTADVESHGVGRGRVHGASAGALVGSCQLLRTWDDPEAAWVVGLAVVPGSQRQGIGRRDPYPRGSRRSQTGIRRLLLTVDPANEPAMNLYLSFGFMEYERVPDFYGRGKHRSLLRRELPSDGTTP